jgi:prophage regulatory protein
MSDQPSKSRRILRLREVQKRVPWSRVTIWRNVRAKRFPAPVQLGPNAIGWYEDEVEAFLAALPRVSYAHATEPAAA